MGRSFARSVRCCIMEYHIIGSIFVAIIGEVSNTVWWIFSAKELHLQNSIWDVPLHLGSFGRREGGQRARPLPFSILGLPQSSWLDYGYLFQSVGFFDNILLYLFSQNFSKSLTVNLIISSPPPHNDAVGLDHLALITCCLQLEWDGIWFQPHIIWKWALC